MFGHRKLSFFILGGILEVLASSLITGLVFMTMKNRYNDLYRYYAKLITNYEHSFYQFKPGVRNIRVGFLLTDMNVVTDVPGSVDLTGHVWFVSHDGPLEDITEHWRITQGDITSKQLIEKTQTGRSIFYERYLVKIRLVGQFNGDFYPIDNNLLNFSIRSTKYSRSKLRYVLDPQSSLAKDVTHKGYTLEPLIMTLRKTKEEYRRSTSLSNDPPKLYDDLSSEVNFYIFAHQDSITFFLATFCILFLPVAISFLNFVSTVSQRYYYMINTFFPVITSATYLLSRLPDPSNVTPALALISQYLCVTSLNSLNAAFCSSTRESIRAIPRKFIIIVSWVLVFQLLITTIGYVYFANHLSWKLDQLAAMAQRSH